MAERALCQKCVCVCVCVCVRARVRTTPRTAAPQAHLSVSFSGQESWSGLPFPSPGDLPRNGTHVAGRFFSASNTWEAPMSEDLGKKGSSALISSIPSRVPSSSAGRGHPPACGTQGASVPCPNTSETLQTHLSPCCLALRRGPEGLLPSSASQSTVLRPLHAPGKAG